MPHPCRGGGGGVPPPHHRRRPPPCGRFFFWQLNTLAIIIVLLASGMVATTDLAFILFSLIYLHLLSSTASPSPPPPPSPTPPVFGFYNPVLTAYISVAIIPGLLIPIAYILDGILVRDKEGIKAAAPHVFLSLPRSSSSPSHPTSSSFHFGSKLGVMGLSIPNPARSKRAFFYTQPKTSTGWVWGAKFIGRTGMNFG